MRPLTRIRRARWSAAGALLIVIPCIVNASAQDSGATTANATKSSTTHKSTKHSSHKKKSARVRGQQKIDSERARTIQEALIREHYLTGEATGTWNQASEDAMRKYQGDHGWQTKEVPDSRALIKLGLGPSKDGLLNPESAMTTTADVPRSDSALPTSHTAQPISAPVQAPATQTSPNQTSPPGASSSPQ